MGIRVFKAGRRAGRRFQREQDMTGGRLVTLPPCPYAGAVVLEKQWNAGFSSAQRCTPVVANGVRIAFYPDGSAHRADAGLPIGKRMSLAQAADALGW